MEDAPDMSAWVLHAESEPDMRRALRYLERIGTSRLVALDRSTVCAELSDPPSTTVRVRLERRLEGLVESRLDCDVAWYPAGRGFVAYSLSQPTDGIESVLAAEGPSYLEVVHPSNAWEPARLCVPRLAVADPLALAEAMKAQGIGVLATYEVGGCRR